MIVLCADELQPKLPNFRGAVVYAGFEDSPHFTRREQGVACEAAHIVAQELRSGGSVLVTCHMGWNRSGLVAALATKMETSLPVQVIISLVRAARGEDALSNQRFVRFLENARC
jgi:protein-tyrosine phosphatase